MNRIYLDQASTSFPKAPGVAQAMMDYLTMNGVNVNRGCYSSYETCSTAGFLRDFL